MQDEPFDTDAARQIWESKYRYRAADGGGDATIHDSWGRVARAMAAVEPADEAGWAGRFHDILEGFRFLPGGRILAGAATARRVTLFNCFVMGEIEDSLDGIFEALKEGALTMQQGGGVGYDFSTLRPRGMPARSAGTIASGPVSFLHVWDSMCAALTSSGNRRGAMMATLRCDHPDIEAFVDAKREPGVLRHFNLSVQLSDAFMAAVRDDDEWPLLFPLAPGEPDEGQLVQRDWPGREGTVPCRVVRSLPARELWQRIMQANYDTAEPGVLFVDRINRLNNLWYDETITATNPCGEIPLPPYGGCDLGAINLTAFVRAPFTEQAEVDFAAIEQTARTATRLLDNVIDASRYPLPQQHERIHGARRIGLGLTGLADCLIMLGLRYDSAAGRAMAGRLMRSICHSAYRASIELAAQKGSFPLFDPERYLLGAFICTLPEDIRQGIAEQGIRNSHLTAIAPTGTISLLAGNVSSGIEPVFDWRYRRHIRQADGSEGVFELADYAARRWRELHGDAPLSAAFVTAREIAPADHLAMQAALQPYVDNAISKTINVPEAIPFDDFQSVFLQADELGLKGCTTFRPNPLTGEVLQTVGPGVHCCSLDRETS